MLPCFYFYCCLFVCWLHSNCDIGVYYNLLCPNNRQCVTLVCYRRVLSVFRNSSGLVSNIKLYVSFWLNRSAFFLNTDNGSVTEIVQPTYLYVSHYICTCHWCEYFVYQWQAVTVVLTFIFDNVNFIIAVSYWCCWKQ